MNQKSVTEFFLWRGLLQNISGLKHTYVYELWIGKIVTLIDCHSKHPFFSTCKANWGLPKTVTLSDCHCITSGFIYQPKLCQSLLSLCLSCWPPGSWLRPCRGRLCSSPRSSCPLWCRGGSWPCPWGHCPPHPCCSPRRRRHCCCCRRRRRQTRGRSHFPLLLLLLLGRPQTEICMYVFMCSPGWQHVEKVLFHDFRKFCLLSCLGSMAAAVQPNIMWNSQKTYNKIFPTSCYPWPECM